MRTTTLTLSVIILLAACDADILSPLSDLSADAIAARAVAVSLTATAPSATQVDLASRPGSPHPR